MLHAKAGLSSIFRYFTKREVVLQGGTSMDLRYRTVCVCAKSLQSCLTLCDRMDGTVHTLDSSVHGILQARILEQVAIFSSGDLPDPGIEPTSPALAGGFFTTAPPGKAKVWGRTRFKF